MEIHNYAPIPDHLNSPQRKNKIPSKEKIQKVYQAFQAEKGLTAEGAMKSSQGRSAVDSPPSPSKKQLEKKKKIYSERIKNLLEGTPAERMAAVFREFGITVGEGGVIELSKEYLINLEKGLFSNSRSSLIIDISGTRLYKKFVKAGIPNSMKGEIPFADFMKGYTQYEQMIAGSQIKSLEKRITTISYLLKFHENSVQE